MKRAACAAVFVAALMTAAPAAAVCDLPAQVVEPAHRSDAPLFVGDSTMQYALPELAQLGIAGNARSCRGFPEAVSVIRSALAQHRLPSIVGIGVGAGWPYFTGDIEHLLRLIGPHRRLALITHRKRGGAPSEDTRSLRDAALLHPRQVILIDWVRYSARHPNWFAPDHLHVTPHGGVEYALFIAQTLRRAQLVERCFPAGVHELAATPLVRVYRAPEGAVWACRFSTGQRFELGAGAPRPLAAAGDWIAFATATPADAAVALVHLRPTPKTVQPVLIGVGPVGEVPRITALVVTPAGHAAWIDERRSPSATVYEVARQAGSGYQTLSSSAEIDPQSLTITGHTISWTMAGKRRRAQLR